MVFAFVIIAMAVFHGCLCTTATTAHHGHNHHTTAGHHHGHHTTVNHGHHGTTTHHQPNEFDSLSFKYDHNSQLMLALKNNICYIYSMLPDEISMVHSAVGLRSIEIKVVELLATKPTTIPMSYVHLAESSGYLYHSCKGKTILQINF